MLTKLSGIIFAIVLIALSAQVTYASPCGDYLDPILAQVWGKYDPESDITVGFISWSSCGAYERRSIAFDGRIVDGNVDLYTLPGQNGPYGDFYGSPVLDQGKTYHFWYFQPDQKVILSQSAHDDQSQAQLYYVDNRYILSIDSTDKVLLQNGIAFISEDYRIIAQEINGQWYYYPYMTQPLHTIYLPVIHRSL